MIERFHAGESQWLLGRANEFEYHRSHASAPDRVRTFLRSCRDSKWALSLLRRYLAAEFGKSGFKYDHTLLEFLERNLHSGLLKVVEVPRKIRKPGAVPAQPEPDWEPVEELRPNNEPAVSMRTFAEIEEPPEMETLTELDEGPEMETESAVEESGSDMEGDSEVLSEERSEPPEYAEDAVDLEEVPQEQDQE